MTVAPVVGHIKDGYELFTGGAKVGADLYQQYNVSEQHYVIETGAPSAVFAGLRECLKDETKNEAISATRVTTSFAVKTGTRIFSILSPVSDLVGELRNVGKAWA